MDSDRSIPLVHSFGGIANKVQNAPCECSVFTVECHEIQRNPEAITHTAVRDSVHDHEFAILEASRFVVGSSEAESKEPEQRLCKSDLQFKGIGELDLSIGEDGDCSAGGAGLNRRAKRSWLESQSQIEPGQITSIEAAVRREGAGSIRHQRSGE